MPNQAQHLSKAEYNENYYQSFDLNNTQYLDWVVNGIFYSALHYIDCYLAIHDKHPTTHTMRNEEIRDDPNLPRHIGKKYNSLKDDSENARYYMKVFTPGEVRQYIIPNLYGIKEYLKQYIPQIRLA